MKFKFKDEDLVPSRNLEEAFKLLPLELRLAGSKPEELLMALKVEDLKPEELKRALKSEDLKRFRELIMKIDLN